MKITKAVIFFLLICAWFNPACNNHSPKNSQPVLKKAQTEPIDSEISQNIKLNQKLDIEEKIQQVNDLKSKLAEKDNKLKSSNSQFEAKFIEIKEAVNTERSKNIVDSVEKARNNKIIGSNLFIMQKILAYQEYIAKELNLVANSQIDLDHLAKNLDIDRIMKNGLGSEEEFQALVTKINNVVAKIQPYANDLVIPDEQVDRIPIELIWQKYFIEEDLKKKRLEDEQKEKARREEQNRLEQEKIDLARQQAESRRLEAEAKIREIERLKQVEVDRRQAEEYKRREEQRRIEQEKADKRKAEEQEKELELQRRTINCDADPNSIIIKNQHLEPKPIFHQSCDKFIWNPKNVKLFLADIQKNENVVTGNDLRAELQNKNNCNVNVSLYLYENQNRIPKEWQGKRIHFWGTIYNIEGQGPGITFLEYNENTKSWEIHLLPLTCHCWTDNDFAALRAD